MRGYHPGLEVEPFSSQQVADAGDIACTPFDIDEAIVQIEAGARELLGSSGAFIALGGDHTIALPLLRAVHAGHGSVALVHFDAHLDTWDTYFGAAYTHGTPFRRAHEEGLLAPDQCAHVGIRGPLFSAQDLVDDAGFGFTIVGAFDYLTRTVASVADELRSRVGDAPVYVSIDIDVLDPAHAPGTGTPEAGGMTSRELLATLRALAGINVVGADVVEVAPAYDHAEITAIAAANVVYELLGMFARR
jgi:agmatinase